MELNENIIVTPQGKNFNATQFTFVNPTSAAITFNLFDANNNTQYNSLPTTTPNNLNTSFAGAADTWGVVYVASTDRIYAGQRIAPYDINVINPNTNTIVNTISGSGTPFGRAIYVASVNKVYFVGTPYGSGGNINDVVIIDCSTDAISNTITVTFVGFIDDLKHCTVNNSVYVYQSGTNSIYKISCLSEAITNTIATTNVGSGQLAYCTTNNTLYVSDSGAAQTFIYSCLSDTLSSTLSILMQEIVYNELKNSLYYNTASNLIELSCSSNTIVNTSSVGTVKAYGLFYFTSPNRLYVVNNSPANKITVFKTDTNTIESTISISSIAGHSLTQLAYASSSNTILGSNYNSTPIYVINALSDFYIVGTNENYNQYVRSLWNEPQMLRQLTLFVQSTTQFNYPLTIFRQTVNGLTNAHPKFPNLSVDRNQYQPLMGVIDFVPNEVLLDGNTMISQYTIEANSQVTMLIYYKQIDLTNLFTNSPVQLNALQDNIVLAMGDPNGESEQQIQMRSKQRITLQEIISNQ